MNEVPSFYLSPVALERYRQLTFQADALQLWNIIPFSTVYWTDEHPLTTDGLRLPDPPGLDKDSELSIRRLVAARTDLWLHGSVPDALQPLWDEAHVALPDWPGFKRLTLPPDDVRALKRFREEIDTVERELIADATDASVEIDNSGMSHVVLRYDLREPRYDLKDRRRPWWKFWA